VTRRARKYVLDTQLFINAFRDPVANEALQRFQRAVQIDPTYAAAYNNLAIGYEHEGDFDRRLGCGGRRGSKKRCKQNRRERKRQPMIRKANHDLNPSKDLGFHRGELWSCFASASGRKCGKGRADFRRLREIAFARAKNGFINSA